MPIFTNPRSVFEQQLDEYFAPREEAAMTHFMRAISIVLHSGVDNRDLVTLYKILPLEQFIRVVTAFNGRTVSFGTRSDLQESLMLATLYFYREVEGKSWEEVRSLFSEEINTIGYGAKIKNLTRAMKTKLHAALVDFQHADAREQKKKRLQNDDRKSV